MFSGFQFESGTCLGDGRMADRISSARRSENMRAIRSKNTSPERRVRSAAYRLGLRFRLHRSDLPGSPDLLFPGRRTALFVHGCFWHRHENCPAATTPKTNAEYWSRKFGRNVERDRESKRKLEVAGWKVLVIWECETKNKESIEAFLRKNFFTYPDSSL